MEARLEQQCGSAEKQLKDVEQRLQQCRQELGSSHRRNGELHRLLGTAEGGHEQHAQTMRLLQATQDELNTLRAELDQSRLAQEVHAKAAQEEQRTRLDARETSRRQQEHTRQEREVRAHIPRNYHHCTTTITTKVPSLFLPPSHP
jgi:septal ring factor EnvC (AmiA/AmiB activator)